MVHFTMLELLRGPHVEKCRQELISFCGSGAHWLELGLWTFLRLQASEA